MFVYVFGNPDHPQDNLASKVARRLKKDFSQINFEFIPPGTDLPTSEELFLIDTVRGISHPRIITEKDINLLSLSPRNSTHDYDLALQLKLKLKLKLLKKLTLIGIPLERTPDYSSLHSIFKKLVAHDMQGS